MRNKPQIAQRLSRVALANELLAWLKANNLQQGTGVWHRAVEPFAREKDKISPHWEIWQAWKILKEAGRRKARKGSAWSIHSFEPVVADEQGNLVGSDGGEG